MFFLKVFKSKINVFLISGFIVVVISVGGILLFVLMNSEKEDLSTYSSITDVTEGPIDMQIGEAVLTVPNGTTVGHREVDKTQREIYNSRKSKGVIVGQDAQGRTFQIKPGEKMVIDIGSSSIDTSSDSSIELTTGWQTYRNDEFGFEVRYPAWWVEDTGDVNLVNPESGSSFQVTNNGNPDNLSLDEWFKQAVLISGRPTVKAVAERIMINGVPAYKLESELSPPNPLFEVVAVANSQGDVFSIYAYYNVQEDAEILNQILATFRFVE